MHVRHTRRHTASALARHATVVQGPLAAALRRGETAELVNVDEVSLERQVTRVKIQDSLSQIGLVLNTGCMPTPVFAISV